MRLGYASSCTCTDAGLSCQYVASKFNGQLALPWQGVVTVDIGCLASSHIHHYVDAWTGGLLCVLCMGWFVALGVLVCSTVLEYAVVLLAS